MDEILTWIKTNPIKLSLIAISLGFIFVLGSQILNQEHPDLLVADFEQELMVEETSIDVGEGQTQVEESIDLVKEVFVDVKGAVKHPGVYALTSEDRVIDAIEIAGGFSQDADSSSVNLAKILTDEAIIYVYAHGEELKDFESMTSADDQEKTQQSETVNINTATEGELTQLNGIGPSKASNIISYREEVGSFQSIDEIKEVSGIGDKTFESLKDSIRVSD